MVITVNKDDGSISQIVTNPAENFMSDMCATQETLALIDGALCWSPRVLPVQGQGWRVPAHEGIDQNRPITDSSSDRDHQSPNLRDVTQPSKRSITKHKVWDFKETYTLLTVEQMRGVIAVNVDGAIAYAVNEYGVLEAVTGGEGSARQIDNAQKMVAERSVRPRTDDAPGKLASIQEMLTSSTGLSK